MEMHQEWGTRKEGERDGDERDGRQVGDTGCDEAADLFCSPSHCSSLPASVCHWFVLSYLLHRLLTSFLFLSRTFFKHHFSKNWNATRKNVHFLSAHSWNEFAVPIVSLSFCLAFCLTIPTPAARLLLFVYFSWVFLQTHSPLYPFTYISI